MSFTDIKSLRNETPCFAPSNNVNYDTIALDSAQSSRVPISTDKKKIAAR